MTFSPGGGREFGEELRLQSLTAPRRISTTVWPYDLGASYFTFLSLGFPIWKLEIMIVSLLQRFVVRIKEVNICETLRQQPGMYQSLFTIYY